MAHSAAMHSLSSSAAQRSADCCRGCAVRPIYRNRSRLLTAQPQSSMACCAEPSEPSPGYAAAATARTVRESTIAAPAVTKADRFGRACGVEGTKKFRWWYSQYYGAHGGRL